MSINIYRREREGGRKIKGSFDSLAQPGTAWALKLLLASLPPTSPPSAVYCVCQSHTGERVTSAYKKQLEEQLGGFPSDFCC